jgi:hypothetical protein
MKRSILFFVLIIAALVGCTKLANLVNISIDLPYSQSISIPQVQVYDTALTHYFPSNGVDYSSPDLPVVTNQANVLNSNNTTLSKISSFSLKSLVLVDSPSSAHFDFLDTVQMFIAKSSTDSMLIAYKYGVTSGLDSLVLDTVANTNLVPYFQLDTFYFKFRGHFRSLPPNSLQKMTVNATMHMVASPLN